MSSSQRQASGFVRFVPFVPSRDDRALSDLIGTLMLLVVTVTLIGVAALALTMGKDAVEPPRLDLRADANPDTNKVTLVHAGGASLDPDDLRVVITAGVDTVFDASLGSVSSTCLGATWDFGSCPIPITTADFGAGDHLSVAIVSRAKGETLAEAAVDVGGPPVAPSWPEFDLVLDIIGGDDEVFRASPFGITATASADPPGSAGRKEILAVILNMSRPALDGAPAIPLHDDGTSGDAVAGDMVFTGWFIVPPEAELGDTVLCVDVLGLDGLSATATTDPKCLGGGESIDITVRPEDPASGGPEIPIIHSIEPDTGPVGTEVIVLGDGFDYLQSLTLVEPPDKDTNSNGEDGDEYSQSMWVVSGGEAHFIVTQGTPPGTYYVKARTPLGPNATSNDAAPPLPFTPPVGPFVVESGGGGLDIDPPTITSFSPTTGQANDEISVVGTNFNFANSVKIVNSVTAAEFGAVFWINGDTSVDFLIPPAATPGAYRIVIRNPGGASAPSTDLLTVTAAPPPGTPPAPTILCPLVPANGDANTEITVTGTGFTFATNVFMTRPSTGVKYGVLWFTVSESELHFLVPGAAPPEAGYTVTVTNPGGSATSLCTLTVDAFLPPAPTVTQITMVSPPADGAPSGPLKCEAGSTIARCITKPNKSIRVTGTSLITTTELALRNTTTSETFLLSWVVVHDGEIVFFVPGAVDPGDYNVRVTNPGGAFVYTGRELRVTTLDEVPEYDTTVFKHVALEVVKKAPSGNGDKIDARLKFDSLKLSVTSGGTTYQFNRVELRVDPLKPGGQSSSSEIAGFGKTCGPIPPTNGIYLYTLSDGGVPGYVQSVHALRFYFVVIYEDTAGGPVNEIQFRVDSSNDPSGYFVLKPSDPRKTVYDIGPWPASKNLTNCSS